MIKKESNMTLFEVLVLILFELDETTLDDLKIFFQVFDEDLLLLDLILI